MKLPLVFLCIILMLRKHEAYIEQKILFVFALFSKMLYTAFSKILTRIILWCYATFHNTANPDLLL
jgi:hypothetical protein